MSLKDTTNIQRLWNARFHEMHYLIPAVIVEGRILIDNSINEYNEDLPKPISEDFSRWKRRWGNSRKDKWLTSMPRSWKFATKHTSKLAYLIANICRSSCYLLQMWAFGKRAKNIKNFFTSIHKATTIKWLNIFIY